MAEVKKKKIIMVTTVSGETIPKTRCRKIREKFYKVGKVNIRGSGDCFRVPDSKGIIKYRTLETGAVVWDGSIQKYVHKTIIGQLKGIVGKHFEQGYFKKDDNIVTGLDNKGHKLFFINEQVAELNNYSEKLTDGLYYNRSEFSSNFFKEKPVPSRDYKYNLEYGCDRYMSRAKANFKSKYKPNYDNALINHIYSVNPQLFDNYTFGVEFETTRGVIPKDIYSKIGLMPLRDGSISGIEYATIPLTGKEGLYALKDALYEIKKRTEFDHSCSMHIHIGGFPRNAFSVLSLFKMMYTLQDEIYDLFPMFKRKNNGIKRQDYTSPLPDKVMMKMNYKNSSEESVKEDMFNLIYYLSGNTPGYEKAFLEQISSHPRNPSGERKWNMSSRYLWFNLIPIIFTNKKTAEFRIFGMPNNQDKLFYFLIMSLALVDFSVNNTKSILYKPEYREQIKFRHIFNKIYPDKRLSEFLHRRKNSVMSNNIERGLNYSEKDIR